MNKDWPYKGFWDRGGDFDLLLWLMLPGYLFLDHEGRKARWPHLYAAQQQKRKALRLGAIPATTNIGHNLLDPNCQFGDRWGRGSCCTKCYPASNPSPTPDDDSISYPPRELLIILCIGMMLAFAVLLVAAVAA